MAAPTPPYPQHTEDSAPTASQETLKAVKADFGMIPNLERTLASAPPALKGYATLWDLFEQTSFTPTERQVVYQTANLYNECSYCIPWHTLLSQEAGMDPEEIEALRTGNTLNDAKLQALQRFTLALLEHRGHPPDEALSAFFSAGYTPAQSMEVILGLATKLMSNYTNGIAKTPLDKEVEHLT